MSPVGGGRAIVEALATRAEAMADLIDYRYETTAERLLTSADGGVEGLIARAAGGPERLLAPSVVLATGGFQGNQEMMARYIGPIEDNIQVQISENNLDLKLVAS